MGSTSNDFSGAGPLPLALLAVLDAAARRLEVDTLETGFLTRVSDNVRNRGVGSLGSAAGAASLERPDLRAGNWAAGMVS